MIWLVDAIVLLTAVEAVLLRRRPVMLWNLAAGVGLLLALRIALAAGWWGWISACLLIAGVAHIGAVVSGWSGR